MGRRAQIRKKARRWLDIVRGYASAARQTAANDPSAMVATPSPSGEDRRERFGDHCRDLVRAGHYRQAEYLLWEYLVKAPRAPQATYLLGICLLMQSRFRDARNVIDRAYRLRGRIPDSVSERIGDEVVFELLREARRQVPDWVWPEYQLHRERFRATGLTMARAIDLLVRRSDLAPRFVQVGANNGRGDPLVGSIKKHRLEGLFIEPQPTPLGQLREMYRERDGLSYEQCAITEVEGPVAMHTRDDRNTLGTLLPDRNLMRGVDDPRIIQVPGRRLETVLKEHDMEKFEILQTDTEGYDYRVFQQVDLTSSGARIVNMEFHLLPLDERLAAFRTLHDAGYACFFSRVDMLAVRRDEFRDPFCIVDFLGPVS